jgi:cation:H+ antiporter
MLYFFLSNSILIGLIMLVRIHGSFTISLPIGFALLTVLWSYLLQEYTSFHHVPSPASTTKILTSTRVRWWLWFLLLLWWSQITIHYLEPLALSRGVSEYIIGILFVAVGTSLPELVTTIIAYAQWSRDIAFGNIIGSNIFNIFGVLAMSSFLGPIAIEESYRKDAVMMMLCGVIFV